MIEARFGPLGCGTQFLTIGGEKLGMDGLLHRMGPEALGFLLAWADPEETTGYKMDFDAGFIEKVLTRAAARVPIFEELAVNPMPRMARSG